VDGPEPANRGINSGELYSCGGSKDPTRPVQGVKKKKNKNNNITIPGLSYYYAYLPEGT
jgi:hypothetical protein